MWTWVISRRKVGGEEEWDESETIAGGMKDRSTLGLKTEGVHSLLCVTERYGSNKGNCISGG